LKKGVQEKKRFAGGGDRLGPVPRTKKPNKPEEEMYLGAGRGGGVQRWKKRGAGEKRKRNQRLTSAREETGERTKKRAKQKEGERRIAGAKEIANNRPLLIWISIRSGKRTISYSYPGVGGQ